jgi:hypothetical protein
VIGVAVPRTPPQTPQVVMVHQAPALLADRAAPTPPSAPVAPAAQQVGAVQDFWSVARLRAYAAEHNNKTTGPVPHRLPDYLGHNGGTL